MKQTTNPPTETVSDCCNAGLIYLSPGIPSCRKCGHVCKTHKNKNNPPTDPNHFSGKLIGKIPVHGDGKFGDSATVNMLTETRETVSECNEIPCTHCVYGNPSCHICHKFPTEPMTTKVEPTVGKFNGTPTNYGATTLKPEPTVEKWESCVVEMTKKYIWTGAGHPVNLDAIDYSKMVNLVRTLLSHSVQEAKAEERERWLKAVVNQPPIFLKMGRTLEDAEQARKTRRARCAEILREVGETEEADNLLSTLSTKEES